MINIIEALLVLKFCLIIPTIWQNSRLSVNGLSVNNSDPLTVVKLLNDTKDTLKRSKRFLRVPYNSEFGVDSLLHKSTYSPYFYDKHKCLKLKCKLLVALAIPVDHSRRNVYFSVNFEVNYYMPYYDIVQGIVPIPFATIDQPGVDLGTLDPINMPNLSRKLKDDRIKLVDEQNNSSDSHVRSKEKSKTKRRKWKKTKKSIKPQQSFGSFLSRQKFYRMIESKFEIAGYNGRQCLLKAICENAENPIAHHNGILGDIFHIVLTPSSSKDENLSIDYYRATHFGYRGKCQLYNNFCPKSPLDLIINTFGANLIKND